MPSSMIGPAVLLAAFAAAGPRSRSPHRRVFTSRREGSR